MTDLTLKQINSRAVLVVWLILDAIGIRKALKPREEQGILGGLMSSIYSQIEGRRGTCPHARERWP